MTGVAMRCGFAWGFILNQNPHCPKHLPLLVSHATTPRRYVFSLRFLPTTTHYPTPHLIRCGVAASREAHFENPTPELEFSPPGRRALPGAPKKEQAEAKRFRLSGGQRKNRPGILMPRWIAEWSFPLYLRASSPPGRILPNRCRMEAKPILRRSMPS